MLPSRGPIAFTIPGISGVTVPATTAGAEVKYRWPQDYKLGGIDFCLRSGVQTQMAATRLRMVDASNNAIELATSGTGEDTLRSVNALLMRGINQLGRTFGGGRFQAFQRIVRQGDIWIFQVFNDNGVDIIPELFFRLETAPERVGQTWRV